MRLIKDNIGHAIDLIPPERKDFDKVCDYFDVFDTIMCLPLRPNITTINNPTRQNLSQIFNKRIQLSTYFRSDLFFDSVVINSSKTVHVYTQEFPRVAENQN